VDFRTYLSRKYHLTIKLNRVSCIVCNPHYNVNYAGLESGKEFRLRKLIHLQVSAVSHMVVKKKIELLDIPRLPSVVAPL
jgi:hypothetical protein